MVNIKICLMRCMNVSYSEGKEPGVCIPRVIAVPYLKFHCEVILRNSPECAAASCSIRDLIWKDGASW